MGLFTSVINFILHIDTNLGQIIVNYGTLSYGILFIIIFAETGFVFTPFLPGDSLLFACGAFAAIGSLNIWLIFFLLFMAAVLGDTVNYAIGNLFGLKLFQKGNGRFLKKEYLDKTHRFYEKYGGKTIVIARFVPIVRTFAPFVAGLGKMSYLRFFSYNVIGGFLWVSMFTFGGFYFGNMPIIKHNFSVVIFLIVIISILPGLIEFLRHRKEKKSKKTA